MGKYSRHKSKILEIYSNLSPETSLIKKSKQIAKELNIEWTDVFRRSVNKWVNKENKTDPNFDNETTTETNQYYKTTQLSALKVDGKVMTIDEYCMFYGIPREHVKSYKLVSHTSIPYYNIASTNIDENEELFGEDFVESLIDKLSKHSPDYTTFIRQLNGEDNNLMVIDCADIHISKLSLAYETGEEYNVEIAVKRVTEGFYGLIEKAKNFNINKVMMVIGNDVLHFDNAKSTTTSGTFQDSCTSLPTAFNVALDLYTKLIDSIIDKYDVDIVFNPSNHDYISGWMLARTIETWYRRTENVRVYANMQHRKYYQYGNNMICTSHGDGAKMQDMPLLMATESPVMWANTKYRYVYLHHIHHKQVTKFQSGKDYIGVTVEYLRSPTSADRWHSDNGYVGAKKAVEAFIHSEYNGQIARITHYF